ncbi:hypothetical protein [Rhodoferax sp. PAMC 29310]|uniref:hypothetical protein n=1 Tax=Rhodoferax sp. PAMC 29310 TaxID=2822760 RepID=UPI001B32BDBE|nr:hypothetical protein [Rhodoferax sp. PAMC 29310]
MNSIPSKAPPAPGELDSAMTETNIAQLVGEVYAAAPPAERSRLLAHLIKPLGILSLMAVANGIFANNRFRSGLADMNVPLEEVQNVQVGDVIILAMRVQQVSLQALNGLTQVLSNSPALMGSAAAIMLLTILVQRAQRRRDGDHEATGQSA